MTNPQIITLRTLEGNLEHEIRLGLTAEPKHLPCKLFYDATGQALFAKICELPEYYLTRTENCILKNQGMEIIGRCPAPLTLVELGSGSATKAKFLIEPCLARQQDLDYVALDISPVALEDLGQKLGDLYSALRFTGLVGEFADGLDHLADHSGRPRLVAFLGSTIGNFDEREIACFFEHLRQRLRPEDRFLLGFDLLKDPDILIPAYDDSQKVTAHFNLNVLARLNAEFGGNFDLQAFEHEAIFNPDRSRIEMHLRSTCEQVVTLVECGLEVHFGTGETVHTENCYKHSHKAMRSILARHGFCVEAAFTDERNWFGLYLVR
jgi:L-histidine N-alpha-methyltransferase